MPAAVGMIVRGETQRAVVEDLNTSSQVLQIGDGLRRRERATYWTYKSYRSFYPVAGIKKYHLNSKPIGKWPNCENGLQALSVREEIYKNVDSPTNQNLDFALILEDFTREEYHYTILKILISKH